MTEGRGYESQPTWRLVLQAAETLTSRGATPFELQVLVKEVQELDPLRSRESIQPTIQGMTVNATGGTPSKAGTPLERRGRGLYVLRDTITPYAPTPAPTQRPPRTDRTAKIPTTIWTDVTRRRRSLFESNLEHLLTEDVLRFELIRALIDTGLTATELKTEVRIEGIGAIDLEGKEDGTQQSNSGSREIQKDQEQRTR